MHGCSRLAALKTRVVNGIEGYGRPWSAADDQLRLALAELKQLREDSERELAIQRDNREEAERLLLDEVEQHSREAEELRGQLAGVVKETTDVKTSIRKGAEQASKTALDRAQVEVQRARSQMEELEDERFELRRALEAHVGALVEAKVDNAEFQGTILELRKELSRVKVKYQRAAARCTKLEAMYYTLKDARDADAVYAPHPPPGGGGGGGYHSSATNVAVGPRGGGENAVPVAQQQ